MIETSLRQISTFENPSMERAEDDYQTRKEIIDSVRRRYYSLQRAG